MTAAQNITWADETICESNPWHLVNTNLATALNVSLAKRFINGMSSPDEDLRVESLKVISYLFSKSDNPQISRVFSKLIRDVVNGMVESTQFNHLLSSRYACRVLANVTFASPNWNNYIVSSLKYYCLLELVDETDDEDTLESLAIAFGNIAIDTAKHENQWDYQYDCVQALERALDKISYTSTDAATSMVWVLSVFLKQNKPKDDYGKFITKQTMKLMVRFNFAATPTLYEEMTEGLTGHSYFKLLTNTEAKTIIGRVEAPLVHNWGLQYVAPVMKILAYAFWCFQDTPDKTRNVISKTMMKFITNLTPNMIAEEVDDEHERFKATTWTMMFFLKYFLCKKELLPNCLCFYESALRIDDDDIPKVSIFCLARIYVNGQSSQKGVIRNIPEFEQSLHEQLGKYGNKHDSLFQKVISSLD